MSENTVENDNPSKGEKKSKKGLWIFLICFFIILAIGLGNSDSAATGDEMQNKNYKEQVIEIDKVVFKFEKYIFFEQEGSFKYFIVPVEITNKNSVNKTLFNDSFIIEDGNQKPVSTVNGFLNESVVVLSNETLILNILYKVDAGFDFENDSIEVDLSITSLGKNVYFKYMNFEKVDKTFEEYYLVSNGVKNEHLQSFINIIKNEKLGSISNINYSYDEETNEHYYVIFCSRGSFGFVFYQDLLFDMYDTKYLMTIYEKSEKNIYYVYDDTIINEFSSLKYALTDVIECYYLNSEVFDFVYGRVQGKENAMYITCTIRGYNSYGMTIYKEAIANYDYNKETNKMELYALKIGDSISDMRFTITFETNCGINIPSQKVTKNYYIEKPETISIDGKTLIGWKIKGSNEFYDFSKSPTSNMTLVAVWE